MLIDGLESCGLLWCFYQLFGLSFWRHPFTADDPLVSKWRNATFLQICSDEETNSSTSWIDWGWVNFQQMFVSHSSFCFTPLSHSVFIFLSRWLCSLWLWSWLVWMCSGLDRRPQSACWSCRRLRRNMVWGIRWVWAPIRKDTPNSVNRTQNTRSTGPPSTATMACPTSATL